MIPPDDDEVEETEQPVGKPAIPDQKKVLPLGAIPKKYLIWGVVGLVVVMLLVDVSLNKKDAQQSTDAKPKAHYSLPTPQEIAQAQLAADQAEKILKDAQQRKAAADQITNEMTEERQAAHTQNTARANATTAAFADQTRYMEHAGSGYTPSAGRSYGGGTRGARLQTTAETPQGKHAASVSTSVVFWKDEQVKPEQAEAIRENTKEVHPRIEQVVAKKSGLLDPDPTLPTYVLPEGSIIEAALDNDLEGSQAGPVIVHATTPVYAPGTRKVVIPQGAKIHGKITPVSAVGQNRLALTFNRVVIGTGASMYAIPLGGNAPGLDQGGAGGIHGKVDSHIASSLAITAAVGTIAGLAQIGNYSGIGSAYDPMTQWRNGVTSGVSQEAVRIMDRAFNRVPTHTVKHGTRCKVFLMQDTPFPEYEEASF